MIIQLEQNISPAQLDALRQLHPHWSEDFFVYLASLDGSQLKISAQVRVCSKLALTAPLLRLLS